MKRDINIHGFVVVIGPDNNRNYFTGVAYSAHINEAQVFRTRNGGMTAAQYWQTSDGNKHKLSRHFWDGRRMMPVALSHAE